MMSAGQRRKFNVEIVARLSGLPQMRGYVGVRKISTPQSLVFMGLLSTTKVVGYLLDNAE